jgi:hypothetical protein
MAKLKGRTDRRKPRARPQTARKRAKRTPPTPPSIAALPPATVHENESEDQLGAYDDRGGETDVLRP